MTEMKTLTIGNYTFEIVDDKSRTDIGDKTALQTDAKDSVVAAINEHEGQINGEAEARANADTALTQQITALQAAVGTPLTAATAAAMTDTTKIYVYVGSESGYTYGDWYYYDGSAWVSGGVYNSQALVTDTTLTVSGVAADSKATGDAIRAEAATREEEVADLKSDLDAVASNTSNIFNPSESFMSGYLSPSGKLNAETLVPALDSTSTNTALIMKAIKATGGKTYAFPLSFNGRLSTYNQTLTTVDNVPHYNRIGYVQKSAMTETSDCFLWTAPSNISYFAISLWKSGGVTQEYIDSFMIIEVDDASTFVFPASYVNYGKQINEDVKISISSISDYDVVGEIDSIKESSVKKQRFNLFDNSKGFSSGYTIGTTADISNLVPTGLVAKTSPLYTTSLQLIPISRGSKFVVSKGFEGEIGIYNHVGGRSRALSGAELTVGNNCKYYVIDPEIFPYSVYYLAFAFNSISYSDYMNFIVAIDVDSLPNAEVDYDTLFVENETKVLASQVVGLVSSNIDDVSNYAYATNSFNESYAARVQDAQKPNCLTITFKTDSHTDLVDNSVSTDKKVTNALMAGYVGDYLGQDVIIHGGDLLTVGYTDTEQPLHNLREYLNRMYKFVRAPFLVAKGNHDDNCYDSRTTTNNFDADKLILPDTWNAIAMQYAKKYAVCPTIGNANYCYIDNERTKIRVFVLDTEDFDYHVSDGVAELNSGTTSAFSNEQLNFVANALLFADKDEPNEWAALFISHRPIDTTTTSRKRMGIGDALIRNHLIMLGIITAYKNGTRYTASGYGGKNTEEINSHYFPYNVNVDYTSKGAGEVIGFLFGHTHNCNTSDEVGKNSDALSYGYRYISCGSTSFYTLVFNRDTKKINVFFYASDKSQVQLVSDSSEFGEIIGLTDSDLNTFGDWETSWE